MFGDGYKGKISVSDHAVMRWSQRKLPEHTGLDINYLEELVRSGQIVYVIDDHGYINNGRYLFPCVGDKTSIIVKSVLVV